MFMLTYLHNFPPVNKLNIEIFFKLALFIFQFFVKIFSIIEHLYKTNRCFLKKKIMNILGFYLRITKIHYSKLYLIIIKTGKTFIYSFFFSKIKLPIGMHCLIKFVKLFL